MLFSVFPDLVIQLQVKSGGFPNFDTDDNEKPDMGSKPSLFYPKKLTTFEVGSSTWPMGRRTFVRRHILYG